MRRVDRDIAMSLASGRTCDCGNTVVTSEGIVYLHGNKIAWVSPAGDLTITGAGWYSRTTASRLNAIVNAWCRGSVLRQSGNYVVATPDNSRHFRPDETVTINTEGGVVCA